MVVCEVWREDQYPDQGSGRDVTRMKSFTTIEDNLRFRARGIEKNEYIA